MHYIKGRRMKKDTYVRMITYFKERETWMRILDMLNKALTILVFVTYPVLLVYLLVQSDANIWRAIVVPFFAFVILSVVRRIINRKRPYEKFETPSLIHKNTCGKSFPSRHVFSCFLIAMTVFILSSWTEYGCILILCGVILALIRVLTGVHYISDVIAGAAAGIIGFVLIDFLFKMLVVLTI